MLALFLAVASLVAPIIFSTDKFFKFPSGSTTVLIWVAWGAASKLIDKFSKGKPTKSWEEFLVFVFAFLVLFIGIVIIKYLFTIQ